MYAFQLWREYKISLAEIYALFPTTKIEYVDKNVCILDTQDKNLVLTKVEHMGGVIKVIELSPDYRGKPAHSIASSLEHFEWKFRYGLSVLWDAKNLKLLLMDAKKLLKEKWISTRFVNKNFTNLSSAQIIGENLVERGTDFTLIVAGDTEYFGKTVWVQDIENYSKRDYGKTRDMEVGMLPPKLAQMMIHISGWKIVYDPFCGLGTVLIESILMQHNAVYGSDISAENIEKTKENITFATMNFKNSLKESQTQVLDARGISSSPFLKQADAIVTEGYLGQIFQKYSVTEKKLIEEKQKLLEIYSKFFEGLSRGNFKGNIVICFPFWDVKGKYFYFHEVYAIIEKYCKILPLLPHHPEMQQTRAWSLLYKRPDQIVGREIFKLKIK